MDSSVADVGVAERLTESAVAPDALDLEMLLDLEPSALTEDLVASAPLVTAPPVCVDDEDESSLDDEEVDDEE